MKAKILSQRELQTVEKLVAKEISYLVHENFGRYPVGAWGDAVLSLRDSVDVLQLENQRTE